MIAVYAIATPPLGGRLGVGVQREHLGAIAAGRLVVVAGEVGAAPAVSPRALAAHDEVVRRVAARARAVLPMRFGAVAADLRALRAFVGERRAEFARSLAHVAGCEQFTLRCAVSAQRKRRPRERALGPGARWLRARSAMPPELAPLRDAVDSLLRDERAQAEAGVVSVYHLVARADRRAYRAALARGLRATRDVRVVVSGPWPVYAFVEPV
jgi:Gas vesicle synthesis protein GvpL/GvpF